jgi:hypothetical protein
MQNPDLSAPLPPVPDKIRVGKAAPPKDPLAHTPKENKHTSKARTQLEQIAKGTPVSELDNSAAEAAPLPDQETMYTILKDANQILLDARDPRLLVTAFATQAADTPLGNEMKLDALRMLGRMSNENLPPQTVVALDAVQKSIAQLNLPETVPEHNNLYRIISNYNETHPNSPVSAELLGKIQSGDMGSAQLVAKLLQTDTDLSRTLWKEITNVDGFTGISATPENILQLSELDVSAENKAKAQALFGNAQEIKNNPQILNQLVPSLMLGAMLFMLVSQVGMGGEGSAGH